MKKISLILILVFLGLAAYPQNWSQESTQTHDAYSICFPDTNTGYILWGGITYPRFQKTIDGSNNWLQHWIFPGGNSTFSKVLFINADTGYVVVNHYIYKTTDGGDNWTANSQFNFIVTQICAIHFPTSETGFVAGFDANLKGKIMKTVDGGDSWTDSLTSESFNAIYSINFTDHNNGYAVGDSGMISATNDGGSNWVDLISGTDEVLNAVHFPTDSTGFVVGNYGIILKTNDGGSWSMQNSGVSVNLNAVYFISSNTGFAVGDSGTILKTIDGGLNWFEQISQTTEKLTSIYFPVNSIGYIAGYNTIVLKNDHITIDTSTNITDHWEIFQSVKVFPNPFQNFTIIKFDNRSNKKHALSLYNVNGKLVLMKDNITKDQIRLDRKSLSKGIYFFQLSSEDRSVGEGKLIID